MERGYIKLHRRLQENKLWLLDPFTRGQAWVDMLLLANYKEGWIRKRGILVTVNRGQLGWSEVALAKRWKWSRGKVRRFFRELKKSENIVHQKDNITSLITIVNYGQYQGDDTPDGQQTDSKRYRNKKVKKEKKETSSQNLELARLLLTSILNRRNGFAKPNLESWAKNIDLMIRVDKRQPDEIKEVIVWCQKDEFWQDNILSTAKLRKQFDQLALKMVKGNTKKKQKIDDEPPYWS